MKWERRYKGSIYAKPGEKPILNNKEISFYRKQPKLKIRFLEETESVVIIFKAKDAYPYKEKLKSFGWKFDGRDKTWNFKESGTASKIKKTFIKILSISRSSGWLVTYSGKIPGEFVKIALGQE